MKNNSKSIIRMTTYGMTKHNDADDDESWITVNGTHVTVNSSGDIVKGPGNIKATGKSGVQTSSKASSNQNGTNNTSSNSKNSTSNSAAQSWKDKFAEALQNGAGDEELNDLIEEASYDDTMSNDEYSNLYGELMDMYKRSF